MEKIVIHGPGGYDRLRIETHPDPVPTAGEVLVRTGAVGVNYADCLVRWGVYRSARELVGWPVTPGFEIAGRVAALGGESSGPWREGDRVLGVTLFGGYASHVVLPSHQVFAIPETIGFEGAAGFPTAFLTAYHALFQKVRLRPEMTVLIHSAAGGAGGALLQLARLAGCRVVGVVGAPHKVEVARAHGADEVIDRSRAHLWSEAERLVPGGFDVILDANGPATLRASYEHLAPCGTLVVYGFHTLLPRSTPAGRGRLRRPGLLAGWLRTPRFDPFRMTAENRSVVAFNLSFLSHRRDLLAEAMTDLLGWLRDGRVRPLDVTAYPFERVADAHRALESGATTGKLVLTLPATGSAP